MCKKNLSTEEAVATDALAKYAGNLKYPIEDFVGGLSKQE